MLVCHCNAVNDAAIRRAIACGARNESDIARLCGAGSDCAGCAPAISDLLEECLSCPLGQHRERQGVAAVA